MEMKFKTVISACYVVNESALLLSWSVCDSGRKKHAEVSTDHLSLRWFYSLEQVKPKQTAGSALQRSALNTCVCDGAHH